MEDDPDDLAAAFFAAQAAKEQQKAKLPTDDWVAAITSVRARNKSECHGDSTGATVTDGVDACTSSRVHASTSKEAGYEATTVDSWLVTTIPSVPMHIQDETDIELNGNECNAFNLLQRDTHESRTPGIPFVSTSSKDEEAIATRERIKQHLVQKLLQACNSANITS
ncbi:hypothetical protein ACHAW6_008195 [Cyclotella cf. meneghiniana]